MRLEPGTIIVTTGLFCDKYYVLSFDPSLGEDCDDGEDALLIEISTGNIYRHVPVEVDDYDDYRYVLLSKVRLVCHRPVIAIKSFSNGVFTNLEIKDEGKLKCKGLVDKDN